MGGHHGRFSNFISIRSLLICLFCLCLGTACSNRFLGNKVQSGRQWICDGEADEAMQRCDYEAGILLHERFLKKEPENALALYHLGYAHGQLGNHVKEVSLYEKAVVLGFERNNIFFNMGMAYGELNQTEKSVRAFKKALDINPDSADNHFGLGIAYQKEAVDKLAEEEFLTAIKIDPRHLDARLSLSLLYADWGEIQKASEQLRKILQIDPSHERARGFLERIEKE